MTRAIDELLKDADEYLQKEATQALKPFAEWQPHNQLIAELTAKLREGGEALENIMVSGNDLSTGLGLSLLPYDLATKYPYSTDNEVVMEELGYGVYYCMWICWATIMRERDKLEGRKPTQPNKETDDD